MDNLELQITPVELNCQAKGPLNLSCMVKKVAISTGHVLEKQELKANPCSSSHRLFPEGPKFNLTRQFEAKNTKISLHFMNKKERNVTCIGSTEIDVATLPSQSYCLLERQLNNSVYPQSRAKIQVRRQEVKKAPRPKSRSRPHELDILHTEGQQKEEWLNNSRRANPNIPTAYEISRRNFKKVEIARDSSSHSNSRKTTSKGSYHQRFKHFNGREKEKSQGKSPEDLPTPRKRTPEPILVRGDKSKSKVHYNKPDRSRDRERVHYGEQSREEPEMEQPQSLNVTPYSEFSERQNINRTTPLPNIRDFRYEEITQKLQLIQERLLGTEQAHKSRTEANLAKRVQTTVDHSPYHEAPSRQSYEDTGRDLGHVDHYQSVPHQEGRYPVQQFTAERSNNSSERTVTHGVPLNKPQHPSQYVPQYASQQVHGHSSQLVQTAPVKRQEEEVEVERKVTRETGMVTEQQSESREKVDNFQIEIGQLHSQNSSLRQQNSGLLSKLADSEAIIEQLQKHLGTSQRVSRDQDKQFISIQKQLEESELKNAEQHLLLSKVTKSYEDKVEEVFDLSQQLTSAKAQSTVRSKVGNPASPVAGSSIATRRFEVHQAEDRCQQLQQELRVRRSTLSEVVNTIWQLGNPQLMQTIQKYMEQ